MLIIVVMIVLGKKVIIFFSVILLLGCKEENLNNFAKEAEFSTKSLFYNIKDYSLKEFCSNIKTAFAISSRTKYAEKQILNIETSRNTQIAGFQSILTECQTFECNILEKDLTKNLLFPENIIGKIELDVPVSKASEFVNSIGKYGNIVKNEYEKDESIEQSLESSYNAIIPLRASFLKVNELLNKSDVYSFERIQEMQKYAEDLNKKIEILENDIKYLTSAKDKRHISIKIERGYNSTFGLVKAKIQNSCLFIVEYIHILILFTIIYLILFSMKKLFLIIKIKSEIRKKKKEALDLYEKQKYKIPPKLF